MAGIDEAFWDQLDARIAATFSRAPRRRGPSLQPPRAGPAAGSAGRGPASEPHPGAPSGLHGRGSWTRSPRRHRRAGAGQPPASAQCRVRRPRGGPETGPRRRRALQGARRPGAGPGRGEVQGDPALAEARIEAIQARADARVQRAEERALSADRRAGAVEDWLAEIDAASRGIAPRRPQDAGRPSLLGPTRPPNPRMPVRRFTRLAVIVGLLAAPAAGCVQKEPPQTAQLTPAHAKPPHRTAGRTAFRRHRERPAPRLAAKPRPEAPRWQDAPARQEAKPQAAPPPDLRLRRE